MSLGRCGGLKGGKPAMAAGTSDRLWEITDLVRMLEQWEIRHQISWL